jgi:carbon storage regulator
MEAFRMLVLSRKIGEKIRIGDDITITVVDIGRSRMKLGIEAPAGHRILREELLPAAATPGTGHEAGAGTARAGAAPRRASPRRRMAVGV